MNATSNRRPGDQTTFRPTISFPEDRLPPQNIEIERCVLMACISDPEALSVVSGILRPDHFYRDSHATIYRLILGMFQDSKPVDTQTLADELMRIGKFEDIGGFEGFHEIMTSSPHTANAEYHAKIVHSKAVTRSIIDAANGIMREAYSNKYTCEELAGRAESAIFATSREVQGGSVADATAVVDRSWARIEARRGGELIGVPTGYDVLDYTLGGCLGNGELVIVAGRPGMGKTSLGLGIAESAALGLATPTLYVSFEMSIPELGERMLSAVSGVPGSLLKTPWDLTGLHEQLLAGARARISASPLRIEEDASLSMLGVASLARREKASRNIGLLIVDYLQLIDRIGDEEGGRQSRQEVVSRISRKFKVLAKELQIPVVALCQLNRESESRSDKRPLLSDLRESGSLEQDADVVLLVHRPDYHDYHDQPNVAEIIVAKNRNGATGKVCLTFQKELARMSNRVEREYIPPPADRAY